ncbi:hypothetical protein [Roseivivax sp.]
MQVRALGAELAVETLVDETIETETYFDGYFAPDQGDVGTVREIPILTHHGRALAALFE